MNRIAKGIALLCCVAAASVHAQTTEGYYRVCANYNPDYQEAYDNVDSKDYAAKSAALDQYLRDSGCRKQVIMAVETVKDEYKECKIPRHPDYDTYQRALISLLGTKEARASQALLDAPIEATAPEFFRRLLKCM